jgi:hypothetical protein
MEEIVNTSRKFLLLIGFLFLVLALLSVSALAKKPIKPPPEPTPDPTHEVVYDERYNFGHVDLMLVDEGGTNKKVLLEGAKQVGFSQPKFSPDGSQIVFVCQYDDICGLCTIDVDGTGDPRPIAALNNPLFPHPTYVREPINGKRMVLYSDDGVGDRHDLFMVPADGSALESGSPYPVNITETEDISETKSVMSHDNTFIIAKGRDENIDAHIYRLDFDAGNMEVTNTDIISTGREFDGDNGAISDLTMAKGDGDNTIAIVSYSNLYVWYEPYDDYPTPLTTGVHNASFLPDGSGFVVSTTDRKQQICIVGYDGSPQLVTTVSKGAFGLGYPDFREID